MRRFRLSVATPAPLLTVVQERAEEAAIFRQIRAVLLRAPQRSCRSMALNSSSDVVFAAPTIHLLGRSGYRPSIRDQVVPSKDITSLAPTDHITPSPVTKS